METLLNLTLIQKTGKQTPYAAFKENSPPIFYGVLPARKDSGNLEL